MEQYFLNILKEVLNESTNITSVSNAIRKRNPVEIVYDDGLGKRLIHPVAYGLSRGGNLVVRAFQPFGGTSTEVPHWKMFRLDKIISWKPLRDRIFDEPPGQFNSAEGKFNPNGDNSMSEVYLVANFERSKDYYSGKRGVGLKKYNDERSLKKQQNDPYYKFKQNVNNSFISKDVTDRVNKNTNKAAKEYVKGNDKYVKDMFKLDNTPKDSEITNTPITKPEETYKQEDKNNLNNNKIENNG